MNLKRATLIAIIGATLSLLSSIINFIETINVENIVLSDFYYVSVFVNMAFIISLIIFFSVLYKNQK